jgi:hypothetical protein
MVGFVLAESTPWLAALHTAADHTVEPAPQVRWAFSVLIRIAGTESHRKGLRVYVLHLRSDPSMPSPASGACNEVLLAAIHFPQRGTSTFGWYHY